MRIVPDFYQPKSNGFWGKNKQYSISQVLRSQNRSNDDFEVMLNGLALEELIALKLELCGKPLKNKPFGMQVWKILPHIIKKAVLLFAISACRSNYDAASFLGIRTAQLRKFYKMYEVEKYLNQGED